MTEKNWMPHEGRELLPEEMEQISGGVLSDEEFDAYLAQFEDPELRRTWEYAICVLYNYKGWDYNRYAGIVGDLAGWTLERGLSNLPKQELQNILLQAYRKFYGKIFS
jgi:hypothetical protein